MPFDISDITSPSDASDQATPIGAEGGRNSIRSTATNQTPGQITNAPHSVRVALLADSFLPHAGGSRVYYYNLFKHLAEDGRARVTVLTKKVEGWKEFDGSVRTDNFHVLRHSRPLPDWSYHQLPRILSPLLHTMHLVRSRRIDLLNTGDLFPQGVIGMWMKQLFGIPYLVFCHGEDLTQVDGRRYQPSVRNAIYHTAEAIIAANDLAVRNLIRVGISEHKIFKITPGVDTTKFSPARPDACLMEQYRLREKLVLLTVGRLVARKGHSLVLKALARVRAFLPPFHYLIVGEGPEHARLMELTHTLHLSSHVTFVGKVPDERLGDFYNLCDLFVLPNRNISGDQEGFGMVFIEANAAGKPVLGGSTGGASEAIIHDATGMLVDPEDIETLAGTIRLLLKSPDMRSRFGATGLRRARTEFSWSVRAAALRDLTLSVLRNVSGRSGYAAQEAR